MYEPVGTEDRHAHRRGCPCTYPGAHPCSDARPNPGPDTASHEHSAADTRPDAPTYLATGRHTHPNPDSHGSTDSRAHATARIDANADAGARTDGVTVAIRQPEREPVA